MESSNHLHFEQTTIIVPDKTVCAIAKQLQWRYPDKCKTMLIMLGPLHFEMAFMGFIGDCVKGSSWADVFN